MSHPQIRNRAKLLLLARAAQAAALILVLMSTASATSPEEDAGCPLPTLEECLQPGYLAGELDDPAGPPCGALQGANDWTCSQLIQEYVGELGYEVDSSIYAHNLDPAGLVAEVAEVPQDEEDATANSFAGELSVPAHALVYGTSLFPDGQIIAPDGEVQSFAIFEPAAQSDGEPSQSLAIEDPRGFWPENGEQMSSCQEYAWERYYDVTKFWFDVGHDRHDSLRTFEIAFAPDGIGTQRLDGSPFRDVTGEDEMLPSVREDVYRNRFFRLPSHPKDPGEKVVPGSPNLRYSLKLYDPELGEYIVNRINNAHDKQVTKDMAYYLEHWENLTVEAVAPPSGPSFKAGGGGGGDGGDDGDDDDDGISPVGGFLFDDGGGTPEIDDYAVPEGDDGGINAGDTFAGAGDSGDLFPITGQVPLEFSDGFPMRRYFAAELDELYELQLEKDRLLDDWSALDRHYEGSGWTIEDLLDELNPVFDDVVIEPRAPVHPRGEPVDELTTIGRAPRAGSFTSEPDDDGGGGIVGPGSLKGDGPPPDPFAFLTPESAARKRVLDGLLAIYQKARDAGCLYDWVTPCDFSPKEFASEAISHAIEEQQAAYLECLRTLPSPFLENLGETRKVIDLLGDLNKLSMEYAEETGETLDDFIADDADDEALALYDQLGDLAAGCVLEVDDTMTATHLHEIEDETAECHAKLPEYRETLAAFAAKMKEHVAMEEAKARLAAIPELLDPDTGEFVRPGRSESWDEQKGTKYFGLDLSYEYKFDTDVDESLCTFDLSAGGEFSATAKILTASIELVDAAAWVKTGSEFVDIHAEVLGIAIFDAIHVDGTNDKVVDFSLPDPAEYETGTDIGFTTNFFLGPIPMSIRVGVGGRVGFRADIVGDFVIAESSEEEADLCPSLSMEAQLGPFLSVYGFVEFAIDIFIARAGIRGELVIIDVGLPVSVGMTIEQQNSPFDLRLSVGMGVKLKLTTLAGNIKVFGEIGWCPLCKRLSKTIAKWDGFVMERKLFEHKYEVSVRDLVLALEIGN